MWYRLSHGTYCTGGGPRRATSYQQRGNRRQETFFCTEDYEAYRALMVEWCGRFGVTIWAYCLMPNHVHLVAVPESEDGLCRALGEAHRRYTRHVNFREAWRGHLWQGRFASFVMDEAYLLRAVRYVELNPVRAGIVKRPGDYPWSSAAAHLAGKDDALVQVRPLLEEVGDWKAYLSVDVEEEDAAALRRHERTGRPLGNHDFLGRLEDQLDRELLPKKRGPKGPWKRN
jgi:putative transposase